MSRFFKLIRKKGHLKITSTLFRASGKYLIHRIIMNFESIKEEEEEESGRANAFGKPQVKRFSFALLFDRQYITSCSLRPNSLSRMHNSEWICICENQWYLRKSTKNWIAYVTVKRIRAKKSSDRPITFCMIFPGVRWSWSICGSPLIFRWSSNVVCTVPKCK